MTLTSGPFSRLQFFLHTVAPCVRTSRAQVVYTLLVKTSPSKLFQQCIGRWMKFARCIRVTSHDVLKATIFVIHTGEDGPNSHVADAYIVAIQTELHATFFHLALYLALAG